MVKKSKKAGRPNTLGSTEHINLRIPATTLEDLRNRVEKGDLLSTSDLIRQALAEYLMREDQPNIGELQRRLQRVGSRTGESIGEIVDRLMEYLSD